MFHYNSTHSVSYSTSTSLFTNKNAVEKVRSQAFKNITNFTGETATEI